MLPVWKHKAFEMAICTHAEWDWQEYCGFVDLGTGIDDNDSLPLAKDALAFMLVAVNSTWKGPGAYFLVNGLSGIAHANLIKIESYWKLGLRLSL